MSFRTPYLKKREHGDEQPHWKAGPFKIRLPFVHYPVEWIELLQGIALFVVGLSIIPVMEAHMGLPYHVALTFTLISGFFFLFPILVGVPFAPGWITPALPIVIIFLGDYEPGAEAIQALVALQLTVAAIFLVLYFTKLGDKLVTNIPTSIKGGILIGVGMAAILGEIGPGGQITETPVSIIIGGLVCLFGLFSITLGKLRVRSRFAAELANYGMLPGLLVAMLVGWAINEFPLPNIEWGITPVDFGEAWQYTPFVLGFPGWEMFLAALPIAFVAYVIAYGDIVVGTEIVEREAEKREDEEVDVSADRLHLVTGLRNLGLSLWGPTPGLGGPIFTAVTTTIAARFAFGRKAMESIYSGVGTFYFIGGLAYFALPLVTLFQPVLPIALSLTLLITGYVCMFVGMSQLKNPTQQGIAGVTAVVLAIQDIVWGVGVGIVLYLLLERDWSGKKAAATKAAGGEDLDGAEGESPDDAPDEHSSGTASEQR